MFACARLERQRRRIRYFCLRKGLRRSMCINRHSWNFRIQLHRTDRNSGKRGLPIGANGMGMLYPQEPVAFPSQPRAQALGVDPKRGWVHMASALIHHLKNVTLTNVKWRVSNQ